LRWGSPTATPPFEPLDFEPKEMFKYILPFLELNGQFGRLTDRTEGTPVPEFNGQFGRLTDRTEGTPVPEPVEGGALLCPQ